MTDSYENSLPKMVDNAFFLHFVRKHVLKHHFLFVQFKKKL